MFIQIILLVKQKGIGVLRRVCFDKTRTRVYCVLYCLYCGFCTVSFMHIYSFLFVLV